jgi:hypothetical protein
LCLTFKSPFPGGFGVESLSLLRRLIPAYVGLVLILPAPALVLAADIDPAKLPGVVVDDTEAELSGNWSHSVHTRPFVGKEYRHCVGGNDQRATYKLRVAEPGHYHVLISYSIGGNRSDAVPVVIHAADGEERVTINQQIKPSLGLFEPLGEYRLNAGEVLVVIDAENVKTGVIIADAVQILTDAELAEVKKNLPVDQPKLAVNAPAGEAKPPEVPEEKAPPFARHATPETKHRLSPESLDALLHDQIGGVAEAKVCDDESFLRRITLDLIGRQPKPEELRAFLADETMNKRAAAVDRLLASPEFGTNWAAYWSDVISYRTPQPELTFLNYGPFKAWLAEELNRGTKWDEIVYRIVTASGKVADSPEVTFVGFHQGDRSQLASETTRVFLSTQIQCAECHNHKFIDLSQETFHHVAAYFARVEAKLPWNDSSGIEVKSKAKGEHKMPGAKDDMTAAAFGSATKEIGASDIARRTELAVWLVEPANPWFAKAHVNRVWARMMGRGFSEPVDEIGELGDHVLPEVFDRVADHFVATEYDVKELFRTIALSKAYQRELVESPKGYVKPFSVLSPGRLRGDEVFAALVAGLELPNVTPPPIKATDAFRFPPPPKSTRDLVNEAFGFDPSLAAENVARTMQQAMFMMNNVQVQRQIDAAADGETVLARLLKETSDNNEVVTRLYERLLARTPTERELAIAREHIESVGDRESALEDVLWSLLNSAEFTSRR